MKADVFATVLSVLALLVSVTSLYFQFIHVTGAQMVMLDRVGTVPQTSTVLNFSNLPQDILNQYPNYHDSRGHCAMIRVPVANEGDRSGYVKIVKVSKGHGND